MAASPRLPAGAVPLTGDAPMTWTTPTASDLRFGFEITMYVAAR
jgi:pyrroloquinoline quinone biosynthesis protein A